METLSLTSRTGVPSNGSLHRVITPPYLTTAPLMHSQMHASGSPSAGESAPNEYVFSDSVDGSPPGSVMRWTSDATRRKQYAEIDKRNSGLRKFIRKILPGCVSKQSSLGFFNGEDDSDAGSVRRFRLELPDEEK